MIDKVRFILAAFLSGCSPNEAAVLAVMVDAYPHQPHWRSFVERTGISRQSLYRIRANLTGRGLLVQDANRDYHLNAAMPMPRLFTESTGWVKDINQRVDMVSV